MDWLISFWSEITNLIAECGLLTVAPIVMITSAGVPLPVPADLLVVLVGVQARAGQHPLWLAWLVLSASMFAGATLMYEVARWIGTGALGDFAQYGRYTGLSEGRLKDAEARIRSGGQGAIFLARFVPVLKTAIVVACGILGVPRRMYMPAMGLAALVYVGFQLALGYLFGRSIIEALEQIVIPLGLVAPLVVVGILLIWLVRARRDVNRRTVRPTLGRTNRIRAGALAGVLAIAGSTLAVNTLIYLGAR
jgi:membrane-associated protein